MYRNEDHAALLDKAEDLLEALRAANQGDTRCRTYSVAITQLEQVRDKLFIYGFLQGDEEGRLGL